MSEKIGVGDLVVVVRACCTETNGFLGKTFVAGPPTSDAKPRCRYCLTITGDPIFTDENGWNFSSWRLKRIPPLEELDKLKREQEITA